jgi:isoquinoline 1-oxidoreductase
MSEFSRREVLQALGAGLLIAVTADWGVAQAPRGRRGPNRGGGNVPLTARLHVGQDGVVTIMSGKVECGQGARAEITQAAAEELHAPASQIRVVLGDTDLCPDDGGTFGSRTTPGTIPGIRKAAAAAREVLVALAAKKWDVDAATLTVANGVIAHGPSRRETGFGELLGDDLKDALGEPMRDVQVREVKSWTVLGQPLTRPNGRDIVTGKHEYPSDIKRPGMQYGMMLRAPAIGSTLEAIDTSAVKEATVVHEGEFVGVVAPTSYAAKRAIAALAKSATWKHAKQVSSPELFEHFRKTAKDPKPLETPDKLDEKAFRQEYQVAYVQHAPLEPRAAVAEWEDGKLTVWTGTQIPTRVKQQLQDEFKLAGNEVRVIVPDFGGGFGGKHSGECAIEAARLAKAAGKPVKLRWTREEEFQWAYFRPAALILVESQLASDGTLSSWKFINVNSGPAGLKSPYRCPVKEEQFVDTTAPPLRHGSYRGLAATANHFAREHAMDELAIAAGSDPMAFRLKHIDDPRLAAVLKAAVEMFDWATRAKDPKAAIGLACGTEKGSYVACCAQVAIEKNDIRVVRVAQAFECGKILNPVGLMAQVKGAIVMGLGPALSEAIVLNDGVVMNGRFSQYRVPRFADVPVLDVKLLDRADLPSAGAGETPIVTIAPAIANAVLRATGKRCPTMPVRVS